MEHLLGDVDRPDHGGAEHLLLASHEVLQEVDGDIVVRRQVDANIGGEEVVDLALAPVLRCELLRGDPSSLASQVG